MIGSRFRWKLFAAYAVVMLPTVAVLGELTTSAVRAGLEEAEDGQLRASARSAEVAAPAWLERSAAGGGAQLDQALRALAPGPGFRISLLAADGALLADTDAAAVRSTQLGERPEIEQARAGGIGRSVREDRLSRVPTAYLALRIDAAGETLGFVRAGLGRAAMLGRVDAVRGTFVWVAALAALFGFVVAWLQSLVVHRQMQRVTAAVDAIAGGRFDLPLPQGPTDDFDELTQALRRVAAHSREHVETMVTDRNNVLAILGVMVEGVVAVDVAGRVVHMNAAAARILGTQAANTEGRLVQEITRVPEVSAMLSRVVASGAEQRQDLRVVQPPRDRHVVLHGTPLHDADGDIAGAVLMLHDVTELRRLEAMRRDFVANVSHELKTPITAIRGMVETVLDDDAMVIETRQRFLGRIREQSFRLSSLVSDLLTLSRLESDGLIGEMAPLDLRTPVRESVEALAQSAEDEQIAVHVEVPGEAVRIIGESESLRLVVGNLLDNALKYTPAGGNVWLCLRAEGQDALLEVRDDGIGIERKHLDRIFQRFYRVDKARSRELGGTGLGLSIVRHVCLAYHGDVSVQSWAGGGSTFVVRLPLA